MVKYWVWLASVCNADLKSKIKILNEYGSPKAVFFTPKEEIEKISWLSERSKKELGNKNLARVYEILEKCGQEKIDIVTVQDARYPERLRNIDDFPLVIFIKGTLPVIDEEVAVAIVGTRKATPYGYRSAEKMGYEIARAGGLVVSGLAAGIDSSGAIGAIKAGKGVVGVLGCNIDQIYPKSAAALYEDVLQVGALISEYPPGHPMSRANFPARNRIISGLSVGVVIVEAPARSGALITASMALEQGRELFVVPGNVDSENSIGSNRLLTNSEAKAVLSARDVLVEFQGLFDWKLKTEINIDSKYLNTSSYSKERKDKEFASEKGHKINSVKSGTTDAGNGLESDVDQSSNLNNSKKVIDKEKDKGYIDLQEQLETLSNDELAVVSNMSREPKHIDDIIDECGLPAGKVLAAMTMLQLKGHVAEHKGKRFSLIIIKK